MNSLSAWTIPAPWQAFLDRPIARAYNERKREAVRWFARRCAPLKLSPDILEDGSVHYYIPPPAQRREILYYPISAGHFECEPSYRVERSSYNSYLLVVMLSGSLSFHTLQTRGTARAGQILLLDCNGPHGYAAQGNCAFTFMHFNGAQSRAICEEINHTCGCLFSPPEVSSLDQAIHGMMSVMQEKHRINEVQTSAMLYGILMQLLESSGEAGRGTGVNTVVDRAVRYIQDHLSEAISVDRMAELSGYSASYFTSLFTKETGMSPHKFLLKSRMERAQQLLQTTDVAVQDIAFQTGFNSAANFCYAFRRETGLSPSDFRKRPM